jgi:hypothetical protein
VPEACRQPKQKFELHREHALARRHQGVAGRARGVVHQRGLNAGVDKAVLLEVVRANRE